MMTPDELFRCRPELKELQDRLLAHGGDRIALPVVRQKCVRCHLVMLQRVHNGDADRRVEGLR